MVDAVDIIKPEDQEGAAKPPPPDLEPGPIVTFWQWVRGRLRRRAMNASVAARHRESEGVWYRAQHVAAAPVVDFEPKRRDFRGLLFYHHIVRDEDVLYVSYWRDERTFADDREAYRSALRGATLSDSGHVRSFTHMSETPSVKPNKVVLLVAGLVTAFFTIDDFRAWVFEAPNFSVELIAPEQILAHEAFEVLLNITNHSQRLRLRANVGDLPLLDADRAEVGALQVVDPAPVALASTSTVTLRGEPEDGGLYRLLATVEGKVGWGRGSEVLTDSTTIRVWRSNPSVTLTGVREAAGGSTLLTGSILVSRPSPQGLDCQATLSRQPEAKITTVRMTGTDSIDDPFNLSNPGSEISRLRWRSKEIDAFTERRFELVLEGAVNGPNERLLQQLDVRCRAL